MLFSGCQPILSSIPQNEDCIDALLVRGSKGNVSILSSFLGIEGQYRPPPSLCSGGQPVLTDTSSPELQYSTNTVSPVTIYNAHTMPLHAARNSNGLSFSLSCKHPAMTYFFILLEDCLETQLPCPQ